MHDQSMVCSRRIILSVIRTVITSSISIVLGNICILLTGSKVKLLC